MVLAHLVAKAPQGTAIALFDDAESAITGPAYSTRRREHLLNVRAGRMGAYPDQLGHFVEWCQTDVGQAACRDLDVPTPILKETFVPRALYGQYLCDLYQKTLATAETRGIQVTHYRQRIATITPEGGLTTARGDILHADQIVCASGFAFPKNPESRLIPVPWHADFRALAGKTEPILLVGMGLTAVDTIVSLLKAEFAGEIVCVSRHCHFPLPHTDDTSHPHAPALPEGTLRLSQLVRFLRQQAETEAHWQTGLDSIRPLTVALWQKLSTKDQKRVLRRYFTWWNIHRHRMAPEVARVLEDAVAQGRVKTLQGTFLREDATGAVVQQRGTTLHVPAASVFDCRGPQYGILPPYLASLIEAEVVRAHPSGAGVCVDERMQIAEKVYALGPLLLGQRLETTAVPELRGQALKVAEEILARRE